jgi:hypothetical protein
LLWRVEGRVEMRVEPAKAASPKLTRHSQPDHACHVVLCALLF